VRVDYAGFVVAVLLLSMVPGTSTAVMLRETMRGGRRSGLAVTIGDKIGLLFWGAAAALGLSALLAASSVAYDILRIVGAAVLVFLGVQSIRAGLKKKDADDLAAVGPDERNGGRTWPRAFRVGLVSSLANAKGAVFAISFLPQFASGTGSSVTVLLLLAVIWGVVDGVWSLLLLWLVTKVRAVLARPRVRRRIEQTCGLVLIMLGVRLVVESV